MSRTEGGVRHGRADLEVVHSRARRLNEPAYNEAAMVLQSIESAARADYPHDRLEILVIDDGSKDDTWSYISQAARRYSAIALSWIFPIPNSPGRGRRKTKATFEGARQPRLPGPFD